MITFKYKIIKETNMIATPVKLDIKNIEVFAYFLDEKKPLSHKLEEKDGYYINNVDEPTIYNEINKNEYDVFGNMLVFSKQLPIDLNIFIRIRS